MTWVGPDRLKGYRGGKPPCPKCQSDQSRVIESGKDQPYCDAPADQYARKRQCHRCQHKWFTYEQNSQVTTYGAES